MAMNLASSLMGTGMASFAEGATHADCDSTIHAGPTSAAGAGRTPARIFVFDEAARRDVTTRDAHRMK